MSFRRLTLRQIIAQLSFSLTGGRKCNNYNYLDGYDIDKDAQLINAELGKILFSELFFGFSDRDESHFIENIHAIKLTRKMNYGGPQGPIVEKKIQDELVFGWAKVPETLKPLMKETVEKITHHSPSEMQTGPAKRGDQTTIELHLKYLEKNFPEFIEIYQTMTRNINSNISKNHS